MIGSATADELLERLHAVERRRRMDGLSGLLSAIALGQLFFAAFAFGHSRGPLPLRWLEVLAGMTGVLLVSTLVAWAWRRRRLEKRAQAVLRVQEGGRRRRVALYEGYLTIDTEVVLAGSVTRVDRTEPEALVVRYVDPRHAGPVLRELDGPASVLDRIVEALPR